MRDDLPDWVWAVIATLGSLALSYVLYLAMTVLIIHFLNS